MSNKNLDILILGAGLSGIGAACHLARKMPHKSYAILEGREAIGGTWDLFRYPGIRSDSDMTTFGYNFKPWNSPRMLADGPAIKQYVTDAAKEHGVIPNIRFGRHIESVEWSSDQGLWNVTTTNKATGETEIHRAKFVISATGYYNYSKGYTPEFLGRERFQGKLVHPQFWPEDLDYAGKKVVIIGSGATAVTLTPTMAERGAQVTMLQRSPTYVISLPGVDALWRVLSTFLPSKLVYFLLRIRNVLRGRMLFNTAQRRPNFVRNLLLKWVKRDLGDAIDMAHFTPSYNPWEQRLCAVPDSDLFKAIKSGKANVVTDTITNFDETGIALASGKHLDADIIITATGLELQSFGGANIRIDGEALAIKDRLVYKGMMIDEVPNFLHVSGYSNASWTLKADIVSEHFLRIIEHMDKTGSAVVTPRAQDAAQLNTHAMSHFSSGYIQRGADNIPLQGVDKPWVVLDDYIGDAIALKFGKVTHPALHYQSATKPDFQQADSAA